MLVGIVGNTLDKRIVAIAYTGLESLRRNLVYLRKMPLCFYGQTRGNCRKM